LYFILELCNVIVAISKFEQSSCLKPRVVLGQKCSLVNSKVHGEHKSQIHSLLLFVGTAMVTECCDEELTLYGN